MMVKRMRTVHQCALSLLFSSQVLAAESPKAAPQAAPAPAVARAVHSQSVPRVNSASVAVPEFVPPDPASAGRPLASALRGAALESYRAAKLLYTEGDYPSALTKLAAAYAASGDPRLLWNMAACHKQLRHYAAVELLVKAYRASGVVWLSKDDAAKAEALLQVVASFVSSAVFRVTPVGAALQLDGAELDASESTQPQRLNLGEHVVNATMPGFEPKTVRFEVTGGQPIEVQIELNPSAQQAYALISAAPGGSVTLDSVAHGRTFEGPLAVGRHRLRVEHADFEPVDRYLAVNDQQRVLVMANFDDRAPRPVLLKQQAAPAVPHWVWLAGGTLLATLAGGLVAWEVDQHAR